MDVNKAIKDLEQRVAKLERHMLKAPGGKATATPKGDFVGATGGIRLLISKKFFDRKRSFAEIRTGLADNGYHYSPQAVQTPLNRMSKAGSALVTIKEGKRKVYATRK